MDDRQQERQRTRFQSDIRTAWAFALGFAVWFGVLAVMSR